MFGPFKFVERLPSEAELAAKMRRVEQLTTVKAESLTRAGEQLATKAVAALRTLEARAERLEAYANRVNAHFEGEGRDKANDAKKPADADLRRNGRP